MNEPYALPLPIQLALHIILEIAEYQLPKLARMEVTGADGGPVRIVASREDEQL